MVTQDAPLDQKALAAARKRIERMIHANGFYGHKITISSPPDRNGNSPVTAMTLATEIVTSYLEALSRRVPASGGEADLSTRAKVLINSDHARGCEGREYGCDCGYDERVEQVLIGLAAAIPEGKAEPVAWRWRWASADDWRVFGMSSTEAGRADFIRDQEKIAPIVVEPLFASPPRAEAAVIIDPVREALRKIMVEQPISGLRETYSDGYASGLATAIEHIDRALSTPVQP